MVFAVVAGTATVHTSGVNWTGVFANGSVMAVIITALAVVAGRTITRSLKSSVNDEIRQVIKTEVSPLFEPIHDEIAKLHRRDSELAAIDGKQAERLARLEGVQEGQKIAAGRTAHEDNGGR